MSFTFLYIPPQTLMVSELIAYAKMMGMLHSVRIYLLTLS